MNILIDEQNLTSMVISPKPRTVVVCPRCNNDNCDRIPRSKIVKLLFADNMRHYKCAKCFKKFYKSGQE